MSYFDTVGLRRFARTAAVLAALLAACDDPTALREPPELSALSVYMILDPDSSLQHALVRPVATEGVLEGLAGEIVGESVRIEPADSNEGWDDRELWPCVERYGALSLKGGEVRCLTFRMEPSFGRTYRVRVSAYGWPRAAATTSVPGDFELVRVDAQGDPPGTDGLAATWTRSTGAYRYLVALRPDVTPWCAGTPIRRIRRIGRCGTINWQPDGWLIAVRDTVLRTVVSGAGAEELEGAQGPWHLDVYAVDRAMYEYLTTGSSGDLFPVPPVQNVEGGYGAVGAWVWRTMPVRPR